MPLKAIFAHQNITLEQFSQIRDKGCSLQVVFSVPLPFLHSVVDFVTVKCVVGLYYQKYF